MEEGVRGGEDGKTGKEGSEEGGRRRKSRGWEREGKGNVVSVRSLDDLQRRQLCPQ